MSYISKDDQFNINRVITPSFLENNPEINKGYELYLLDYAAAFGSINIFRYLWMKNAKYSEKLMEYFIIGGNSEIFDFLKKNWIDFNSNCCMLAIEYYYFEIWEYLINNGEFELVPPNSSNIMLIDDNFYGFDDLFGDPLVNQDESKITYVITQPTIGNIISFSSYPLNIEIIYQCFIKNQNKDKVKKTDLMSNIVIDTLEEIYKSFLNSMCPMTFYMLAQFIQHQENIDINLKNKVLYLYSRFILFFKKEFQSNINNTLLHIACFEGQHEITDFLLKQPNIDINAKNNIFLFIQSHIQSIKNIH
ncbi:hypothetical protein TRFO_36295 [Tritrichomonas foetus]|uniref:DUF3447 domain-containing protein n=1 Tax=Tritrichomonas foetus TaxID=1144522 RepID=A0A1J4JGV8_9EUKA|nr:hypothetical protein TRFO_36295 [Tritrichomonas foetus]|eukprot:OHS97503.1 hypothetical protein TRFO_36295 [Tritrichomonas foetus]